MEENDNTKSVALWNGMEFPIEDIGKRVPPSKMNEVRVRLPGGGIIRFSRGDQATAMKLELSEDGLAVVL